MGFFSYVEKAKRTESHATTQRGPRARGGGVVWPGLTRGCPFNSRQDHWSGSHLIYL